LSAWGLDTTTALRLLTGQPPAQAEKAKDFVIRARRAGEKTYVFDLVVAEAYHALQFHYGVPKKVARRQVLAMLSSGLVLPQAGGHAIHALIDAGRGGAGVVDRMIHARYAAADMETVTFDTRLGKLARARLL
jgi:predicted nucleic acid-binding protein